MAGELCLIHYKPSTSLHAPIFSSSVRRYFAQNFPHDCFHNHAPSGGSKYRGAPVQFKVINEEVYLLGLGEGAAFMKAFQWPLSISIPIGRTGQAADLEFQGARDYEAQFTEGPSHIYRTLSPYLALNQEAYGAFLSKSEEVRRTFIEKRISDHILTAAKWCGVWVTHRIESSLIQMRLHPSVRVKEDLTFVGLDVMFETNTAIPDYMGIGRFVSRGFGTVVRYG